MESPETDTSCKHAALHPPDMHCWRKIPAKPPLSPNYEIMKHGKTSESAFRTKHLEDMFRRGSRSVEATGAFAAAFRKWGKQRVSGSRPIPQKEPPRVQVPNNHILSKTLTYITTILKPSTQLLGPLNPWGTLNGTNSWLSAVAFACKRKTYSKEGYKTSLKTRVYVFAHICMCI